MADAILVERIKGKASAAPLLGTDSLLVARTVASVTTGYNGTLADVATYVVAALSGLALTVASLNVGNVDTTISRVSAGRIAVEGSNVLMASDVGVSVQAYDADLASWASVTRASGFDTFAATPSSANLAALVTGETGSGALVFATSPTLITPALGAATATSLTVTPASGTAQVTINGQSGGIGSLVIAAVTGATAWFSLSGNGSSFLSGDANFYHDGTRLGIIQRANLPIVFATNSIDRVTIPAAGGLLVGGASVLTVANWTVYSPTVTAGSGTLTTVGTVVARYLQIGKIMHVSLDVPITTNGTGATSITVTLPAAAVSNAAFVGRESGLSGKMLNGVVFASSTTLTIRNYDDSYPGANGARLVVSGSYEVA